MKQKLLLIVSAILIAIAYILFLTTNLFTITQTYVSPFSDPIRETYKIGIFSLLFGYDLQQRFNPTILIYLFLIIESVVLFVFSIVIKNGKRKKLITLLNILANSFLLLLSIFLYKIAESYMGADDIYLLGEKHSFSITFFIYFILVIISIVLLSFSLVSDDNNKLSLYDFIINLIVAITLFIIMMIIINTEGAFHLDSRSKELYLFDFIPVTFGMFSFRTFNILPCLPIAFIIASITISIVLMTNNHSNNVITISNFIKSFMLVCAGIILILGQKIYLSTKRFPHIGEFYSFSTTWYKIGIIIFVIGLMCAILEASKMIKRIIILSLIVLLTFCLYSCEKSYTVSDEINSLSFDVLSYSEVNNVFKELEERELKYEIIKNLLTIVDKIAPESENFVISPLSLYLSLEMLYEIGDEQVKNEINEFVHINEEIVKETSKLILALSNVNSNFNISNSVWIEKSSSINEKKVKEFGNKLLVECFSTDFLNNSAKASKDIGNYLYNKTNGMINNSYLFDSLTAIVLANTMYLKEKWNKKGELETKKLDFKGLTNTINTEFLQGTIERGKIGETDNSRFFYIKLKNNFKLTLFIPKGDNTLFDIMDANNLYAISLYDYIQTDGEYTYGSSLLFPSFKVDSKNDLLEYFEKNNLLTNTRSVFKSSICENDLKISNILHDVSFKVNQKGIEGASSTVIRGATSSGLPEKLETLLIDQPFGFILSYDDYILFAGQIVDIK